ncbi:MAG: TonB-dependent receptor [Deltaproteobacteria bacterium]|nr:TonB-dependent receptor [Deltaproteobacteria bacterium]
MSAAAKHDQSTREAPSVVTVITREEIRRFGYRNLAEALRSVPGFYISNDRNYTFLGVRGFLRPGDYSDRVLLLVNGHTYNDDVYQQAFIGDEFGIDLEAIDHIEVIRGPGSALYGGNALFAVINVVTSTGAQAPGVQPLVETGSFGRKRGQMSAGHVTKSGIDVFASGSVLDIDGPHELFFPEFDSPATNHGIARDADAERALNFFLSARYGAFTLQGAINDREKHIPTASFGSTFNDNGSKTVDGQRFVELSYAAEVLRRVNVNARAFYDNSIYHGTYILGRGADRQKNEDFARTYWVGGEVRARWDAPARNAITFGNEYTYHPNTQQENFTIPGHVQFLDDARTYSTYGVYVQDEFAATRTVTLIGGARYDRYYGSTDQVSPRGAILWSPYPKTDVKLLYGQAFRPANLYEQYYAYKADGFAYIANAHLLPERITNYEAALEQEVWHHAQASITLYHYIVKDLINQVEVPGESGAKTLQFLNNESAHGNGVEFGLRVPVTSRVSVRSSYSLLETRDGAGHLLSNSPKHLGNVGVLFPIGYGVEGGAELMVVGPRHTLTGRTLETVCLLNLNLTYTAPIPNLRLAVGLYNILDQHYADPGGSEHIQDRIPQDGFTFRAQVQYAF